MIIKLWGLRWMHLLKFVQFTRVFSVNYLPKVILTIITKSFAWITVNCKGPVLNIKRHQDAFFGFLNVLRCIKVLFIHFQWTEAREKFEKAADLMAVDNRTKKTIWGQFWSAHQVSKQFIIVVVNFYLR